jgi:acyl-CoA reductase-like NAD-dependent aldehyde dehydrogenase
VLAATVLADVPATASVCAREVFGPLVAVLPYASFDEAISLANDSRGRLRVALVSARGVH